MATIQELLADSLEVLRQLQDKEPNLILRGTEAISRTPSEPSVGKRMASGSDEGMVYSFTTGKRGRHHRVVHVILAFCPGLRRFTLWL